MEKIDYGNTMSKDDIRALDKLISEFLCPNMLIAEIGTWKGRSASIFAKRIKNSGGKLFVIDDWKGIPDGQQEATRYDIYTIFKNNMITEGLWDIIFPLVMTSINAAQIFQSNILDLVYIDADHRYEAVKEDISLWLPKVKLDGILAGHDYFEANNPSRQNHPGVTQAIKEILGNNYIVLDDSCVWYHVKDRN